MVHYSSLILAFLLPFCLFAQNENWNIPTKEVQSYNDSAFECKDNNLERAEEFNQKAQDLLSTTKEEVDPIVRSNTYSIKGVLAFQKSNYTKALKNYFTALDIRIEAEDHSKIGDIYINIANLYYQIGDYRKAVNYHKKATFHKSFGKSPLLESIPAYNGLTLAYESLNQKDSLEKYYTKAFAIIDQIPDKMHNSIATIYLNYGQYKETNQDLNKALDYYLKALKIQSKLNNWYDMAWTYHHMGIVKDYQLNSIDAKHYFHKAEKLAVEQHDLETQKDLCKSWMLLYIREKKNDSIIYYFDRYEEFNSELNEEKTNEQLIQAETKYQSEKKEEQLKIEQIEKANMRLGIVLGSVIVLILFFFLIRNYRQKQRISLMQLNLKNREIDDLLGQQETASYAAMLEGQDHERLRIAQDLHDRLGSTLAAIKFGMQGNVVETQPQNIQLVDTAITEVRAIAHNLSGGNIERYGLNTALQELEATIERSGKIAVELYLEDCSLNNQLNIELYRIVQELISNTLKHANASVITIQTNNQPDNFNLIYEDNGIGFNNHSASSGMGLRNIGHRLKKWDGSVEIDSKPGRGSITIINIPKTTPL